MQRIVAVSGRPETQRCICAAMFHLQHGSPCAVRRGRDSAPDARLAGDRESFDRPAALENRVDLCFALGRTSASTQSLLQASRYSGSSKSR